MLLPVHPMIQGFAPRAYELTATDVSSVDIIVAMWRPAGDAEPSVDGNDTVC